MYESLFNLRLWCIGSVSSLPWSLHSSGLVRGLIFCDCTNGYSSTGSLGSLALVTPPLVCGEGLAVAVLVTSPLSSGGAQFKGCLLVIPQWENQPQLLLVTPAHWSQSLKVMVTPHHSREGGWTHGVVSSPGTFCAFSSRLLYCRWWATLHIVLVSMQMKL